MVRVVLLLVLTMAVPATACRHGSGGAEIPAQPIRDEKEPGETVDTVGAVPDTVSGGVSSSDSSGTSTTEIEVEIDEESEGGADPEKSASESDATSSDSGDAGSGDSSVEVEIDEE